MMRALARPAGRQVPIVKGNHIVTAAPSPHRPRTLRRIGPDGREEFCTQDGWIPVRRVLVMPGED